TEYFIVAVRFEIQEGLSLYVSGSRSGSLGTSWLGLPLITPSLCDLGIRKMGPLNSFTSSRKIAAFITRGEAIPSSFCQKTKSWCQSHTSPSNACLALTLSW